MRVTVGQAQFWTFWTRLCKGDGVTRPQDQKPQKSRHGVTVAHVAVAQPECLTLPEDILGPAMMRWSHSPSNRITILGSTLFWEITRWGLLSIVVYSYEMCIRFQAPLGIGLGIAACHI